MKENKIVITDEGMKVIGFDYDTAIASLIEAIVTMYDDHNGPINRLAAGKRIIDVLHDERRDSRIEMLWEAIMCDYDDDDEDDDEDD